MTLGNIPEPWRTTLVIAIIVGSIIAVGLWIFCRGTPKNTDNNNTEEKARKRS